MRLHTPAAKQVQHHRQVQPAFVGGYIDDVACPYLVRCISRAVALQQVGGRRYIVLAVVGNDKLPLPLGLYPVLLHGAPHPLLAHSDAARHQFFHILGQQGFITDARIRAAEVEWHVHIEPSDPGRHLKIRAANLPTCILCASQCSVAEMSALTQHIQSMRKQLVGGTPLTLSSTTPIA